MSLQIKRRFIILPRLHMSTSSKWISYLSIFSALAIIGVLFHDEYIGQLLVVVFGVTAIFSGIKSEESFKLALVSFAIIMIMTLIRANELAQYFATYAFLLLGVGLICAIKEHYTLRSDVFNKSYISGVYSRNYMAMPRGERQFINRRSR